MPTTSRPLSLIAELTHRCPLQCPFCSNPLELIQRHAELDAATWLRVLEEAAALGVVQVNFSGGEPLMRRDLPELIRRARELDLYSNLSTGATAADAATLERLQAAGLDALQISLPDARPEGNNWLTGSPSFERKQQAVFTARRLGFPVTLNVVLHRHNLDHLDEIIELAVAWSVDKLELAHVQYTGWAFRNRNQLLPSREQLDQAVSVVADARARLGRRPEILHVLPDYFQEYPKACLHGWGTTFLAVAPDGAVLPCQSAREIVGLEFPNVREASLEEIWFHAPAFERFRGTDWLPEPCQSCDRREIDFGGCRCQAFLVTGDMMATDPVCRLAPLHHLIKPTRLDSATAAPALAFRR